MASQRSRRGIRRQWCGLNWFWCCWRNMPLSTVCTPLARPSMTPSSYWGTVGGQLLNKILQDLSKAVVTLASSCCCRKGQASPAAARYSSPHKRCLQFSLDEAVKSSRRATISSRRMLSSVDHLKLGNLARKQGVPYTDPSLASCC